MHGIRKNLYKLFQNHDLVEQLSQVLNDSVSFKHVLKASNCPGNVAADKLARDASKKAMSIAILEQTSNV